MINKLKQIAKELKDGYNRGKNLDAMRAQLLDSTRQVLIIEQFEYEGRRVTVVLDELFLQYHMHQFCNIVYEDTPLHIRINTDRLYSSVDTDTRKFLLYHEIGHCMCGHMGRIVKSNTLKRGCKSIFNIIDEMEVEADNYAVSKVGKEAAIKALKEIYKHTNSNEAKLRINRIECM